MLPFDSAEPPSGLCSSMHSKQSLSLDATCLSSNTLNVLKLPLLSCQDKPLLCHPKRPRLLKLEMAYEDCVTELLLSFRKTLSGFMIVAEEKALD